MTLYIKYFNIFLMKGQIYMNENYENEISIFNQILENPQILTRLPIEYQNDIDFLELFYIILNDKIKPYISPKIYEQLKHREIIFKNKHMKKPKHKPNISLEDELTILHNILTDIKTINCLPTTEKYNNNFLELLYIIWGDEIENYIPHEMYEELKNERLMKEYHKNHQNNQERWAEEENNKILKKLLSNR